MRKINLLLFQKERKNKSAHFCTNYLILLVILNIENKFDLNSYFRYDFTCNLKQGEKMLRKVLSKAKTVEEEKVGVSFQIPKTLKKEFDILCAKHNVTITSMLQSLIEVAISEDKGEKDYFEIEALLNLNSKIVNLQNKINGYYYIDEHGNKELDIDYAIEVRMRLSGMQDELERLTYLYQSAKGEHYDHTS